MRIHNAKYASKVMIKEIASDIISGRWSVYERVRKTKSPTMMLAIAGRKTAEMKSLTEMGDSL